MKETLKKWITFLKSKGIEPTADEIADLMDNPAQQKETQKPIEIDTSNLQHNKQAIEELKKLFSSTIEEKDKTISDLTSKMDNFLAESLKEKEERAAKEKAYQDDIEKKQAETVTAQRKAVIDKAIAENKIAPKTTELIEKLDKLDIETVTAIIENMPNPAGTNNNQGKQTNTNNTNNGLGDEFAKLTSGINANITKNVIEDFKQL